MMTERLGFPSLSRSLSSTRIRAMYRACLLPGRKRCSIPVFLEIYLDDFKLLSPVRSCLSMGTRALERIRG